MAAYEHKKSLFQYESTLDVLKWLLQKWQILRTYK